MDGKFFLTHLIQQQFLSKEQIKECLQESKQNKQPLYQVILQKGYLNPQTLEQIIRDLKNSKGVTQAIPFSANQPISSISQEESIEKQTLKKFFNTTASSSEENELFNETKSVAKKFGKYEVLEKLAQGGMGIVYKVWHPELEQIYALKCIILGDYATEGTIERFTREAKLTAKLKHPHIIQVIDSGEEQGQHYFVMEFVEGETLEELIHKNISIEQGLEIIKKTLYALHYAHTQGIIHRDLKPSNIFVTKEGEPKIGDFGLAKDTYKQASQQLTKSGEIMGTPAYMSPEQASGKKNIDAQSDIYSMGACLYNVLTQLCPSNGETLHQLFYSIMEEDPYPPSKLNPQVHRNLETIVFKSLQKDPQKRYPSAKAFADDLERFTNGESILARPSSLLEKLSKKIKKHKFAVFFVVVSLLAIAFVGLAQWRLRFYTRQQEEKQHLLLAQHLEIFENGIKKLQSEKLREVEIETTVFEIAKLPKKEIFAKLLEHFEKGNKYFLENQNVPQEHVLFYQNIVRILDRMNISEIAPLLFQTLEKLVTKYASLSEEKLSDAHLNYMVQIAGALGNLELSEYAEKFNLLRVQMGKESLFYHKTTFPAEQLWKNVDFSRITPEDVHNFFNQAALKIKENPQGAILDFTQIIELNPQYTLAYLARGKVKNTLHAYKEALPDFDQALRLDPKNIEAYLIRGETKLALKDMNGALADYSKAVQLAPDSSFNYNCRGKIKKEMGDFDGSLLDYNQAIRLNPNHPATYNNRGLTKECLKDFQGALEDFNQAISLDTNYAIAYCNRGRMKENQKDLRGAMEDYNKSLSLEPEFFEAWSNRGLLRVQLGDLSNASFDFNEAIRLAPKNAIAYNNRGTLKELQTDFQGAISDYTQSLLLNPKEAASVYFNRAKAKHQIKDWSGALEDYTQVLALNPKDYSAFYNRGLIYTTSGKSKEAYQDFTSAIQIHAEFSIAYYERGKIFEANKYFKEALEDYQKSMVTHPRPEIFSAVYFAKARVLIALNRHEEAISTYNALISLRPEEFLGYFNRGIVYLDIKEYDNALIDFTKVTQLNPNYPLAYYQIGKIYYERKNREKTFQYFQRFLDLSRSSNEEQTKAIRDWVLKKYPELKK